jgi:hypothetical protein
MIVRRTNTARIGAVIALFVIVGGCAIHPAAPPATQPATAGDPKTTLPTYWFDQPAFTEVHGRDFDALWNACQQAAKAHGFVIDRTDYREGLLYTEPLVSKGFFEVWRNDVVDGHGLAQGTLATMRRTIRFAIRRQRDGSFVATPKVVVERYASIERRITSAAQYHDIFSIRLLDVNREREQTGAVIPAEFWYAVARDHALERELARDISQRVHVAGRG